MLDLDQLDLSALTHALQDHSPDHEWWFDPATGELALWSDLAGDELDEGHPEERDCLGVEPIPSSEAYQDMVEFVERIAEADARGRLERSLAGRGAFRRFKDELYDHPQLQAAWFEFSDARMVRRAAHWLADHELISDEARDSLVAAHPDPPSITPPGGRAALAAQVAAELRELFGDRLRQILMFGSSARGDAGPDSDLDLLVVLNGERDFWADQARMDEILWDHTLSSGILVSALPVAADDLASTAKPALRGALADGLPVT